MPGPGAAPKPASERVRRNKKPQSPSVSGMPAPAPPLPDVEWSKYVRDWYQVWVESPQGQAFQSTDWQRLHMLAPQVEEYGRGFDLNILKEIRIQESLLGATLLDRLRLQMTVEKPTGKDRVQSRHRPVVVDLAS